jgi:hypothetical protein
MNHPVDFSRLPNLVWTARSNGTAASSRHKCTTAWRKNMDSKRKKMGTKYYCIEDFHISFDSNQSEMYSYATNVTAPAGADFTKEGKRPL